MNVINPLAAIASGAMTLDYLGETKAAQAIENSVMYLTANTIKDMGAGKMGYSTSQVGDLVAGRI
jgi:3-isopropylmalate dehydrogenase